MKQVLDKNLPQNRTRILSDILERTSLYVGSLRADFLQFENTIDKLLGTVTLAMNQNIQLSHISLEKICWLLEAMEFFITQYLAYSTPFVYFYRRTLVEHFLNLYKQVPPEHDREFIKESESPQKRVNITRIQVLKKQNLTPTQK